MFALAVLGYSIFISLWSGIILACVRLNEPFYRFLVRKEVRSWFGLLIPERVEKNLEDIQKNPAFMLLSAQLSIELIYSILVGITEHTVGQVKSKDWKQYQSYDFSNKNKILIESMIVTNPRRIEIASVPVNSQSVVEAPAIRN